MAINYLDVYDTAIGKAPSTAAARRKTKKRATRLTAETAHGQLAVKRVSSHPSTQRRTPLRSPREENVVKKRRSKAQKAATRKMIAANKRRSKGKRRGKRRNPILVTGKNLKTRKVGKRGKARSGKKKHAKAKKGKSSKRSLAAKKAARTRKANKLKRSLAAKKAARSRKRGKGHSKKKGSSKKKKSHAKKHGKKKAAAKSRKGGKKRKSSKRSAAAKKGARTRKRNAQRSGYQTTSSKHYNYDKDPYAGESRRKKRRAKKNPIGMGAITNPIPLEGGLDFFSGMFAVVIGYLFAGGADRMGATHALTASNAQGGFVDAPATGQIYDSESPQTPIWSSGMRIAFNALAIAAPMGISAMIKSKGPKSFFQLMAMAAIARTVGKAAEDGMSIALKTTGFGLRLYAPELAAQAKLASAATAALPQAAPATFAGAGKAQALNGAPVVQHQAPPPPAHHPASANAPVLAPPAVQVAGGPRQNGALRVDPVYNRPAFNPFASTDDR